MWAGWTCSFASSGRPNMSALAPSGSPLAVTWAPYHALADWCS
jgi:hypothetical protein